MSTSGPGSTSWSPAETPTLVGHVRLYSLSRRRFRAVRRAAIMPALMPRSMPVREGDLALLHVLEAYIETLRAENEILKRRLAAAEARAAERERCPWWCRRLGLA